MVDKVDSLDTDELEFLVPLGRWAVEIIRICWSISQRDGRGLALGGWPTGAVIRRDMP